MRFQLTPELLFLIITAIIPAWLAAYIWRRRRAPGAKPFIALMLALVFWQATYVLELAANDLSAKISWASLEYLSIAFIPLAWLAFALEYARRDAWLTRFRLMLLSLEPLLALGLVFTNQMHRLFWTEVQLISAPPFLMLDVTHGLGFWIHATYSYALLLGGAILIVQAVRRRPLLYRRQMAALLLALVAPWLGNAITIFGLIPTPLDLTPFAFTITGLAMAWSVFRLRMLDLTPIARETVIGSMSDGMIIFDVHGRIADLNPAAQRITGTSASQAMGRSMEEVFSTRPDLIDRYRNVANARDEISIGEGELRRNFELRLSTLHDQRGSAIGRVVTLHDVTAYKQAESRLLESEARYRLIVENAGDIIYHTDLAGCFTYVNPPAIRIMGFASEADLLGKQYLQLVHSDWHQTLQDTYARQFRKKEQNTYQEFLALMADGHTVWIGQNVQLLLQGDNIIGFQAIARDISERKRVEEALARARDQALEASRLKSQLLAVVSHELRTPLGAILGYAELLHDGSFGAIDERQKKVIAEIIDSTHDLTRLVNEVLDEAQMDAHAIQLHTKPFTPVDLLQRVEAKMVVLARNKRLELTTSISPDLPAVLSGDETRLQQILINLIGNAIKFTTSGKVNVRLYCPNIKHWAIEVSDTGPGINKEAQPYIFEPFRQIDSSVTREHRGAGLGLSIVNHLVELMGGAITLDSDIGRGSIFTITLPLESVQEVTR